MKQKTQTKPEMSFVNLGNISIQLLYHVKEKKKHLKFGRKDKHACQAKSWWDTTTDKRIEEMIADVDDKL